MFMILKVLANTTKGLVYLELQRSLVGPNKIRFSGRTKDTEEVP